MFVNYVVDTQNENIGEELKNTSIKNTSAENIDEEKEQNEGVQGKTRRNSTATKELEICF